MPPRHDSTQRERETDRQTDRETDTVYLSVFLSVWKLERNGTTTEASQMKRQLIEGVRAWGCGEGVVVSLSCPGTPLNVPNSSSVKWVRSRAALPIQYEISTRLKARCESIRFHGYRGSKVARHHHYPHHSISITDK